MKSGFGPKPPPPLWIKSIKIFFFFFFYFPYRVYGGYKTVFRKKGKLTSFNYHKINLKFHIAKFSTQQSHKNNFSDGKSKFWAHFCLFNIKSLRNKSTIRIWNFPLKHVLAFFILFYSQIHMVLPKWPNWKSTIKLIKINILMI